VRLSSPAIVPALLTPFEASGAVDQNALGAHVEWLVELGVDGLMPCGTTGETALLTDAEVLEVVRTAVAASNGRVPVIAHVGRPSTRATIALGRRALDAGATAVSAVVPYYYPLEQGQILDHYGSLMQALDPRPVLAYSIPSHGVNDLHAETLAALAREGLAGFKDSTQSLERHREYADAAREAAHDDFALLVGSATLVLESLRCGSAGAVLALANLKPELCVRLRDAFRDGRQGDATSIQEEVSGAEQAVPTMAELKRALAERLGTERGIDYDPELRAPLGAAGRILSKTA
jgi:4-hydroxy-tetrahydrodipicolinate synthase